MLRVLALLAIVTACAHPAPAPPAAPTGLAPWSTAIAGSTEHPGVIAIRERADHAILFELSPRELGRELGLALAIRRGTGTLGLIDGTVLGDTLLVVLRRAGNKIYVVRENPVAHADKDSGLELAVARGAGESVIGALPIVSEGPDGRVLADASELLASDLGNIASTYGEPFLAKPDARLVLDPKRSFVEAVHGFPANVEIDTVLTFASQVPPIASVPNAIDPHALTVGVRWSWFALPEHPMRPRVGDDRVGYFAEPRRDYTRARIDDVHTDLEYIHRWRLEPRQPGAARSEPIAPIHYYIDASVPAEYRGWIREGVLAWNKAFEAAGLDHAIVVEDAPAGVDYLDIRYSTIHWSTSYDTPYLALGSQHIDPRTGEILSGSVQVIADALVWYGHRLRQLRPGACGAAEAAGDQLALARVLAATGLTSLDPGRDAGGILKWLVMHEVGHTLGLRHNFRASASIPYAKLQDREWSAIHGTVASVMDYPALNVGAGFVATPTVGDYDTFAIAFGYTPLPADPDAARRERDKLLATVGDPLHAYATDEDNWLDDWAVDALTSGGDLGDDPIAFATERLDLLDRVMPRLGTALVGAGQPFGRARDSVTFVLHSYTSQLANAMKLVGGATVTRVHQGDAAVPVTPVPVDRQRRALRLVIDRGFAERGYHVPPELLALLGPQRSEAIAANEQFVVPVDYPIHAVVLGEQRQLLASLLSPARLQRVVDNQARAPGAALSVSELFATVTAGMFGELDAPKPAVSAFRRNLQRAYVDILIGLLWASDAQPQVLDNVIPYAETKRLAPVPPPADARAAARHELAGVLDRASRRAAASADPDTRAHLEELAVHIRRALDTVYSAPVAPPAASAGPGAQP